MVITLVAGTSLMVRFCLLPASLVVWEAAKIMRSQVAELVAGLDLSGSSRA
jgi:hypothetical protein